MIRILADHDIEGQAKRVWDTLTAQGWHHLVPLEMVMFVDVGLATTSPDRTVWRFAQAHGMILLTNNRNMKGRDSLAQTLREENQATLLPVVTIGDVERIRNEREYRERCVSRLVEILLDVETYLGTGRLFIP